INFLAQSSSPLKRTLVSLLVRFNGLKLLALNLSSRCAHVEVQHLSSLFTDYKSSSQLTKEVGTDSYLGLRAELKETLSRSLVGPNHIDDYFNH
uniref:hypothetical protein n=1 Tax=Brasilonema octagenarum TaxID=417105 RepID=UPI001B7CF873